jgi:hypothetical protein
MDSLPRERSEFCVRERTCRTVRAEQCNTHRRKFWPTLGMHLDENGMFIMRGSAASASVFASRARRSRDQFI